MGRRALLLSLPVAIGCGAADEAGDGGGGSSDASTTSGGDVSSSDDGGDGGLQHGVVEIELGHAADEVAMPMPYAGTAKVVATLQYRECLAAFYDVHPELRQEGPEGAAVFGGAAQGGEGWLDRLCLPGDGIAPCSIESITQALVGPPVLTIVYVVSSDELGDLRLRFGPLPTMAEAMCAVGQTASVRIGGGDAVHGLDDTDAEAWHAAAYSPAEAVTDVGPVIRVTPEG